MRRVRRERRRAEIEWLRGEVIAGDADAGRSRKESRDGVQLRHVRWQGSSQ